MMRRRSALAGVVSLLSAVFVAGRRGFAAQPVEDKDLVAKAQAQGTVSIYIAMPAKVTIEQRSGHYDVDVVIAPGLHTDQLKRSGFLVALRIPEDRDYRPGYVDPDGYWRVGFMNTDALAYNVNKVKQLGLPPPKAWMDLTKPEWRGNFALYNGSYEWYAAMRRAMGPAGD